MFDDEGQKALDTGYYKSIEFSHIDKRTFFITAYTSDDEEDCIYCKIYRTSLDKESNNLTLSPVGPRVYVTGDNKCFNVAALHISEDDRYIVTSNDCGF